MALDYSWGCYNGVERCFRTDGTPNTNNWELVGVSGNHNCEGSAHQDCTNQSNYGGARRRPKKYTATTSWKGFLGQEMTSTSYLMMAGGAILGAVAARKLIKKGDKNLNTALGGIVGLIAGFGATKIIK